MSTNNVLKTINEVYKFASEQNRTHYLNLDKVIAKIANDKRVLNLKVKIDTGKFCNARCGFCYYLDRVQDRDFLTIEEVRDDRFVEHLLERGVRRFEFSGGEPTLCWDLPEIIDYIRYIAEQSFSINPNDLHFSIVTNGYKLRDKYESITYKENHQTITKEPEYKYIEEILFSLHGYQDLHNQTTKISKSYQKITEFIEEWLSTEEETILKQFIKRIRVNVVVQPETFNDSDESFKFQRLLIKYLNYGIQVNLLPVNSWGDASNQEIDNPEEYFQKIEDGINHFLITTKKLRLNLTGLNINYLKETGSNILNIRYFSMCQLLLENNIFKRYIQNHYDHLFDQLDWNKVLYPLEKDSYTLDGNKRKNYYRNLYVTPENAAKVFFLDANQSHYLDKTCLNCKDFLNLHCDGQKYINQQTNQILNSQKIIEKRQNYVRNNRKH